MNVLYYYAGRPNMSEPQDLCWHTARAFHPMPLPVRFLVEKVAKEHFYWVLQLSPVSIIPPMLCTHPFICQKCYTIPAINSVVKYTRKERHSKSEYRNKWEGRSKRTRPWQDSLPPWRRNNCTHVQCERRTDTGSLCRLPLDGLRFAAAEVGGARKELINVTRNIDSSTLKKTTYALICAVSYTLSVASTTN